MIYFKLVQTNSFGWGFAESISLSKAATPVVAADPLASLHNVVRSLVSPRNASDVQRLSFEDGVGQDHTSRLVQEFDASFCNLHFFVGCQGVRPPSGLGELVCRVFLEAFEMPSGGLISRTSILWIVHPEASQRLCLVFSVLESQNKLISVSSFHLLNIRIGILISW